MTGLNNARGVPTRFRGFPWSKVIDAMVGSSVAQGDLLTRGGSDWSRFAAGTSGGILKTLGAGADPIWAVVSSAVGGAMTFMGQATVAGSPATTLSVSGLDLNSHGCYLVQYMLNNASVSANDLSLYYNSDTTAANYDREYAQYTTTTSSTSGANTALFLATWTTTLSATGFHLINISFDAKVTSIGMVNVLSSAARLLGFSTITWRTASTNVTGITISGSQANGLSIGSLMRVWKVTT